MDYQQLEDLVECIAQTGLELGGLRADLLKAQSQGQLAEDARWLALITAILCLRREYDLDGDLSPVRVQDAQDKAIELLKKMKKKSRISKSISTAE